MLIEFRVENYRSIRDEQVLTMEAGRSGASDDLRPRSVDGYSKRLLPVAALYGANASGKSNVLGALAFLREAVIDSHRYWLPEGGIPQDPFAWGEQRTKPTSLEIELVLDGVRYRYGVRFDDRVFLEEWLFAWPLAKKQTWFTREKQLFTFGANLKGENAMVEGITRPNALYLSAASQLNHPQLSRLYAWFRKAATINVSSRSILGEAGFKIATPVEYAIGPMLDKSGNFGANEYVNSLKSKFVEMLRSADVGIVDVRASRSDDGGANGYWKYEFKHQSNEANSWLPLAEESRGTRTLFKLALPVLRALDWGSLLLVDELEASMHPNLAEHIVRQFNDPEINTRGAQLIFSTHDTNLLGTLTGEPVLRRDQVWLTEKNEQGATVLYPLTDFTPRKDENIERGYVQGRYGAIPYLGNFRVEAE